MNYMTEVNSHQVESGNTMNHFHVYLHPNYRTSTFGDQKLNTIFFFYFVAFCFLLFSVVFCCFFCCFLLFFSVVFCCFFCLGEGREKKNSKKNKSVQNKGVGEAGSGLLSWWFAKLTFSNLGSRNYTNLQWEFLGADVHVREARASTILLSLRRNIKNPRRVAWTFSERAKKTAEIPLCTVQKLARS